MGLAEIVVKNMVTSRKSFTLFLPSALAERLEKLAAIDGRSQDDVVREALANYMRGREWEELLRYGHQRGTESGIAPEEVPDLVEKLRSQERDNRQ